MVQPAILSMGPLASPPSVSLFYRLRFLLIVVLASSLPNCIPAGGSSPSTPTTTPAPPTIAQDRCTRQRQTTALYESIQVVGNYLTEEWKVLFLEYVQKRAQGTAATTPLPPALLDGNVCWGHQEPPPNPLPAATDNSNPTSTTKTTTTTIYACADPMTRTTTDWNAVTANERVSGKAQLPPVTKEISAGAKRLLKVNKKGLQPMSAFFSAAKKTKK